MLKFIEFFSILSNSYSLRKCCLHAVLAHLSNKIKTQTRVLDDEDKPKQKRLLDKMKKGLKDINRNNTIRLKCDLRNMKLLYIIFAKRGTSSSHQYSVRSFSLLRYRLFITLFTLKCRYTQKF